MRILSVVPSIQSLHITLGWISPGLQQNPGRFQTAKLNYTLQRSSKRHPIDIGSMADNQSNHFRISRQGTGKQD